MDGMRMRCGAVLRCGWRLKTEWRLGMSMGDRALEFNR